MIRVDCTSCGRTISAVDASAGHRVRCRACSALVDVPLPALSSLQVDDDDRTTPAVVAVPPKPAVDPSVAALRVIRLYLGWLLALAGLCVLSSSLIGVLYVCAKLNDDLPTLVGSAAFGSLVLIALFGLTVSSVFGAVRRIDGR